MHSKIWVLHRFGILNSILSFTVENTKQHFIHFRFYWNNPLRRWYFLHRNLRHHHYCLDPQDLSSRNYNEFLTYFDLSDFSPYSHKFILKHNSSSFTSVFSFLLCLMVPHVYLHFFSLNLLVYHWKSPLAPQLFHLSIILIIL